MGKIKQIKTFNKGVKIKDTLLKEGLCVYLETKNEVTLYMSLIKELEKENGIPHKWWNRYLDALVGHCVVITSIHGDFWEYCDIVYYRDRLHYNVYRLKDVLTSVQKIKS